MLCVSRYEMKVCLKLEMKLNIIGSFACMRVWIKKNDIRTLLLFELFEHICINVSPHVSVFFHFEMGSHECMY